jgi:hypothetical protein
MNNLVWIDNKKEDAPQNIARLSRAGSSAVGWRSLKTSSPKNLNMNNLVWIGNQKDAPAHPATHHVRLSVRSTRPWPGEARRASARTRVWHDYLLYSTSQEVYQKATS